MSKERYTIDAEHHRHYIDGKRVPGVTGILKAGGAQTFYGLDNQDALYRGNFVHAGAHLLNQGVLDWTTVKPEFKGYLEAWGAFLNDTGARIRASEMRVWSGTWRYAGILDSIAEIKDRLTLIDLKTGAEPSPSWPLQTAGYKIAYQEMTRKKIMDRLVVQVRPNGTYTATPHKNNNDENEFLSFVVCHNWRARNGLLKREEEHTDGV